MAAKKKQGGGRATPKGTQNPTKTPKAKPAGMPDLAGEATTGAPPHELTGKAGKQSGKVNRPTSHNRGNR